MSNSVPSRRSHPSQDCLTSGHRSRQFSSSHEPRRRLLLKGTPSLSSLLPFPLPPFPRRPYVSVGRTRPRTHALSLLVLIAHSLSPLLQLCPYEFSSHLQLPKGAAPTKKVGGPISWYKAKYFEGENASGAPFIHAIGLLFLVGYTIDCEFLSIRNITF